MFVSVVIITFSLLLFLYWFRYTCLLILNTRTTKDYTVQVAQANQLEFVTIQAKLRQAYTGPGMEGLHVSLDRDYKLLTGLLKHASEFELGGVSIEQRMLMVDFQVMKSWYGVANRFAKATHAREALVEMSDIVAHFANTMGERSAAGSRA